MKRRLEAKILTFSLIAASLLSALLALGMLLTLFVPTSQKLGERNRGTIARIRCSNGTCDVGGIVNDYNFISADYVLMRTDYFFIDQRRHPGFWIEYSKLGAFDRFRTPADWKTSTGEVWRLYARQAEVGGRKVEVVVGVVTAANYLMGTNPNNSDDEDLVAEAKKIVAGLRNIGGTVISLGIQTKADGYEVIDPDNEAVIDWGGGIPAYFPSDRQFRPRLFFIDRDGTLNLSRTDYTETLIVVSLQRVSSVWFLAATLIVLFLLSFFVFRSLASTVLRRTLALVGTRSPTIPEALKRGEGQEIEFKRGIVDDEILKSIVAFANTNDGTIFIGVDDDGKIVGVKAEATGAKSALLHKIYGLVRQRIKPIPAIDVRFDDVRGFTVARIVVPRGDERLYFLDGIIYVRHGDSDVKGEPSVIGRILEQYA